MKPSRLVVCLVLLVTLAATAVAASGTTVLAQDGTGPGPIVYTSNRSGNYEIYVIDPQTGLITQLTNNPANDVDPQWSPDGALIVFASDRDGDYELFVMRADGTDLRQLTNNQSEDRYPRWQPDGKNIVYASDVNQEWDLYLVSADGAIVRQITNDAADERGPGAAAGPGSPVVPTVGPVFQPTATQSLPDATVNTGSLNVRSSPGEGAQILTAIPRNTPVKILARYSDNTWVKVQTPNGTIGWVYQPLLTVTINLALIPVENPPFIAPPPTNTPIPPTVQPSSQANLVAGIVVLDPAQPTCQQTFTVGFDVANLGSVPTSASGTVSLVDTRSADGSVQGTTIGGFPVLQPGQTFRVNMPLTISTWYDDQHTITLVIDPTNQIPESVEGDNTRTISYTLQKGSCP